jgi:hypothetical protein
MNAIVARLLTALIAAFSIAGANAHAGNEQQIVLKAKERLERDLKDPDSVRYRKIVTVDEGRGASTVCGEFNARNSMGGYVGYQTFVVVDGDMTMIAPATVTDDELRDGLTRPLSGNGEDPVFIWSFCKDSA